MPTEKKPEKEPMDELTSTGLSRREFLRNAGFVVGGATIGSLSFLAACKGETVTETATVTKTVGAGSTVTVTQTATAGAGTTTTVTKTATAEVTAVEGLVHLIVNNVDYWGVVKPEWTLAYVLREKLALTGTKRGCNAGDCGLCSVIMDGRIVVSCLVLAIEADGKKIQTIEGEATGATLTTLQQAWIDNDALQCGFCSPGMIMTAKALLAFKPKPTVAEIKEFMAGTVCRCGANVNIIKAIQQVAG